jgi:DNA-binding NtrC family response regulator
VNTSIYYNQARLGSALSNTAGQRGGQNVWIAQKGILIVEDDESIREFLRMILSAEGYQVFEANSEAQALKIWNQNFSQIDLLFTDICIPYRTTGVALAKKLRAEKSWLKVLYTSGFSPDIVSGEEDCLVVNVNFLCKPYSDSKLVEVVEKALGIGQRQMASRLDFDLLIESEP